MLDIKLEALSQSFTANDIAGSTVSRLTDDEWENLIPSIGLRAHIRESFSKKIKDEKSEAWSQLQRRGISMPIEHQTAPLIPIPKITQFFKSSNVLKVTGEQIQPIRDEGVEKTLDALSIVNSENLMKMMEYMFQQENRNTFTPLLMRVAVLELLRLNENNIRCLASKLATLQIGCGDTGFSDKIEEQWRSKIKYYLKQEKYDVNLEEHLLYFFGNRNDEE